MEIYEEDFYDNFEHDNNDYYYSDEEEVVNDPPTTFVPGHLATPIYNTECDMLLEMDYKKVKCRRHKILMSKIHRLRQSGKNVLNLVREITDPHGFLIKHLNSTIPGPSDSDTRYKLSLLCGLSEVWAMHLRHSVDSPMKGFLVSENKFREYIEDKQKKIQTELIKLLPSYRQMIISEIVKDKICFKDLKHGQFSQYQVGATVILEADRDIVFLHVDRKLTYIMPTSQLLSSLDIMQGRFPLFMYWKLSDIFEKYPGHSLFDEGTKVVRNVEELRSKLKEGFYGFIATWESFSIGSIIAREDDAGCTQLLETQRDEMQGILEKNNIAFDLGLLLPKDNSKYSTLIGLELTGLSKAFGFPTLDSSKLLDQLRKYGTSLLYNINLNTVSEVNGVTVREFCKNYRLKHGNYPEFKCVPSKFRFLLKNRPIPKHAYKDYTTWSEVLFNKTFDYDYTPDQTELVKDSAAAPPLESWSITYDACAFKHLYDKDPPIQKKCHEKLRTLTHFLTASEDEIRKIITARENMVYLENDHISVQCGKEKELKEGSGRAFNKQTNEQRYAQTSLEYNISHTIFDYVPHQAMTDSELSNTLKILDQNKKLSEGNSIFVSLDLTKWCIHWRAVVVAGVSQMLDDLFGLKNIYLNSHTNFVDCNIFTNNRLTPPDHNYGAPIPGPYYMNRYLGGFEGMQQKKWTLFTGSLIILALEKCELKGEVMGQGDNQVIIITFDPTWNAADRDRARTNFMLVLDKMFMDIHHKLKEKETWFSKMLHEFSKNRYYKGTCVSQGTKKAIRLIPDGNDGLFSLPSSMSTLNTMTEAIARGDYTPHVAFIMNCFLNGHFIIRKRVLSKLSKVNMMLLLMTPADFGGFPRSTLNSHMTRGYDDKVTLWLSIVKTLTADDSFKSFATKLTSFWVYKKNTAPARRDRERLVEDPYCLNIYSLPSADSTIKGYVEKVLKSSNVTNPIITKLYSQTKSVTKSRLTDILDSADLWYPQLGHEVFSNSNEGLLARNKNKFTSSKTMEKIVKSKEKISLIDLITRENAKAVDIINRRLALTKNTTLFDKITGSTCVLDLANSIREESWGRRLIFITKPEFSCQTRMTTNENSIMFSDSENSIITQISSEALEAQQNVQFVNGPFNPFIGKSTRVKMTKLSIDFSEKTNVIKALKNLLKMRAWFVACGLTGYLKLVDLFIEEKKEIIKMPDGVELNVDALPELLGGNIVHRFKMDTESALSMLNMIPSVASNFAHSTNKLRSLTEKGEDYTIHYQYMYVMIMSSCVLLQSMGISLEPFYLTTLSCKSCTKEIENCEIGKADVQMGTEYLPSVSYPFGAVTSIRSLKIKNSDCKKLMAHLIGKKISESIDSSFNIFHDDLGNIEEESLMLGSRVKKIDISLNDFKVMDLKEIFASIVVNSRHVHELLSEKPSVYMVNSYDRSFTPLATIILESGLLSTLMKIIKVQAPEHNMLTLSEKLSALISRYFMFLNSSDIHEYFRCALEKVLIIPDNQSSVQKYLEKRMSILLRIMEVRNPGVYNSDVVSNIIKIQRKGNLTKTLQSLGIGIPEYIECKTDDLILCWRSIRSEFSPKVEVLKEVNVKNRGIVDYPTIEYITYIESISRMSNPYIKCNILAFYTRQLGYISSAPSKFLECLIVTNLYHYIRKKSKGEMYCLAEGAGATARVLGTIFKNLSVAYNSLNLSNVIRKDDITETTPPALQDVNWSKRLHMIDYLNLGVTDITTEEFKEKIVLCMSKGEPVLVTMDAESMVKSTNFVFCQALLPTLQRLLVNVIIFKMFLMSDFRSLLESVIDRNYSWCLFKPCSSNPLNQEVYLIVYLKGLENEAIRKIKRLEDQIVFGHIFDENRDVGFDETRLKSYLNLSDRILDVIEGMGDYSSIKIMSKYSMCVEKNSYCSMFCMKMLVDIISSINRLHSEVSSHLMFTRVRSSGVNDNLIKECCLLLFCILGNAYKDDLISILKVLHTVLVRVDVDMDTIRTEEICVFVLTQSASSNFFDVFGDGKHLIRELSRYKRGAACRCPYTQQYLYYDELKLTFFQTNLRDNLARILPRKASQIIGKVAPLKIQESVEDDLLEYPESD